MRSSRLALAGLTLALTAAAGLASAQDQPSWKAQGDVDLMVGQYFYNGQSGSVNGYGNADAQLLRSLSSDWGFYLEGHSTYTGFKQVDELAGGGTLFQQSWDSYAGMKWVKRYDDGWSLKPRVGFRYEMFRETVSETWGNGLYDFWRPEAGLVLEHKTRLTDEIPWTWQLSYDAYYTHYPHFQSLTSQFGPEQTAPNPGSRILDTVTNQFGYRNEYDLPNFVSAWIFYSISFVDFTDQKVVEQEGQFLSTNRSDVDQSLSAGASKRYDDWQILGRVRPVAGLSATLNDQISNQNDFDADPSNLKYTGGYYNYWEAHLAPSLTTTFLATKTVARLSGDVAARYYSGRLAQNADQSYTGNKLYQYTQSVSLDASQPVWRDLEFKARASWSNTHSNTSDQSTYVYNYHDFNYYAGFGWRFQ